MGMSKVVIDEFLDEVGQRAERDFKAKPHQAFVAWYIEAEYGSRGEWDFVDDAKDGGIDAVGWRPEDVPPVVLIQSKCTGQVGKSQLQRAAYRSFRNVVQAFRLGGEEFEEFLATVRDDLRAKYRKAFNRLQTL